MPINVIKDNTITNTGVPAVINNVWSGDNSLNNYQIKGNTVQTNNLLPVEYKAIDFIESHGTEYIDTGYAKPNTKCRVKTRVSFNDTTSRFLLGPSGQSPNYFGRHVNNKFELNNVYTTMTTTVGTIYDLGYVCNGTTVTLTASGGTTTETLTANQAGSIYNDNWFVYGLNTGSSASFILKGKIYKFELYDNNTLVRDMIPAKRLTDNVLGMYDKVEGKFYTNAGTGSFSGAEEMSKNLLDATDKVINSTTSTIPNYTFPEPIEGNVVISCDVSSDYTKVADSWLFLLYRADNSYAQMVTGDLVGKGGTRYNKIITNSGGAFVRVVSRSAGMSAGTLSNWAVTKGSTAPTSYQPYGQIPADTDNTCDIPSTTHPVELHSVGDKTENILNKNDSTVVSGYYLNANGSQGQSDTWFITPYIPCEPNTVYSQYGITNRGGAPSICYYDKNKNYISGTAHNGGILYPITTPANAYYFRDSFHVSDKDNMTIVKGSTAPTSYIPYGYKVPIFHQGDCGVVDLGSLDWVYRSDLQAGTFGCDSVPSKQKSLTNQFIAIDGFSLGDSASALLDKQYCGSSTFQSLIVRDIRYTDATAFKKAMSGKYLYYQRTTDTEWTTGVQTIYSANPLRKISDTYYDYIDYENQRIVRNVGVYTCTGTENWNWNGVSTGWFYLLTTCDVGTPFNNELCTHLQYGESGSDKFSLKANKYIYIFDNNGARWGSDTTTFKAWLATQYSNDNPVIILYPLATPTYEAITLPVLPVETQDKLNLYNVQTKLAPSEISVTYRGNLVEGHNITYNNKYYPIKYNNTDY